jgi:hypothetical protein
VGGVASKKVAIGLIALGGAACVPGNPMRDRESTCRIARSGLRGNLSPTDLVWTSQYYPVANFYASRAYHARLATIVLTSLGAAGLVGAFATGFAADTSLPPVRAGLYSVVGGTIGLGAGALLSGWMGAKARTRAYVELDAATREECPQ